MTRSMNELWPGGLAYKLEVREAVDLGYLCPPVVVSCPLPGFDPSLVRMRGGDFDPVELERVLMKQQVARHAAECVDEHCGGRRGLVFTVTVDQAYATHHELGKRGIRSAVVSGQMKPAERRSTLEAFRRGEIQVVCNCAVLTEGFDDAGIGFVVIARPTHSSTLARQMPGRAMRLYPGKQRALLIDIAGVFDRHDLFAPTVMLQGADATERPARDDSDAEPNEDSPTRNPYAGLFREQVESPHRWLPVEGRAPAWACNAGSAGSVLVVEEGAHRFGVYLAPCKGAPVHQIDALDRASAHAAGESLIRQTDARRVARKNAAWRDRGPTAGQLGALRVRGLTARTRGEASDALTADNAARALRHILRSRRVVPSHATPTRRGTS